MKKNLFLIFLFSKLIAEPLPESYTLPPLPKELTSSKNFFPYVTVGFSSLLYIPYIANTSIGIRHTQNNKLLGFDGSLNYSSNILWHNLYVQGFLPLHFTPYNAKNSFYFGPFVTLGKVFNKFIGDESNLININASPDLEAGLSIGKNNGDQKITSFWQITTRCIALERKTIYTNAGKPIEGPYALAPLFPSFFRFEWGFTF